MLDDQPIFNQVNLHGLTAISRINLFANAIAARNRNQFRLQTLTENPGLNIALNSGQRTATQRAIDCLLYTSRCV